MALSFDDAPDPTNTAKVLDDLAAANLKATFFVNTNNQMSVANDGTAQTLLKRIVSEGHTLGSHTVDHISLDDLSTTRIEYELGGLETELTSLGLPTPKVRHRLSCFHYYYYRCHVLAGLLHHVHHALCELTSPSHFRTHFATACCGSALTA